MVHVPGLHRFDEVRRRYGLIAGLHGTCYRVLRKATRTKINHLISIKTASAKRVHIEDFECRFLNADDILRYSADPVNDLDGQMERRLASGLDFCYAAIFEDKPVSLSWFAIDSIEAEHCCGLPASFPQHIAYYYKSYTIPKHRGRGINQAVVSRALEALAKLNIRHVFGTIEMANWSSLRSSEQIGFKRIGYLISVLGSSSRVVWKSDAFRDLGILFGRNAPVKIRST